MVVGAAIAIPVGVVVSGMGGRVASSRMVSFFSSIVHEFDAPESVLGVAPPSEDGLSVVGDFAPMLVEEDVAAGIAEDSDREEVVDEAGQSVGEACFGW